jgi:hypothetical protein
LVDRGKSLGAIQRLGEQCEYQLLVGSEAIPEEDHLRQRIVDDIESDFGEVVGGDELVLLIVDVIDEPLADRLGVERLTCG